MSYRVDPQLDLPPSRQLVARVLDEIARGTLGAGSKLPSVRQMAVEALVNPNTVGKAYRELEHLGVVQGRNGSGVFVTDAGPAIAVQSRQEQTLSALREGIQACLRSGQDPATIEDLVRDELYSLTKGKKRA